jgi:hypothetical protein
LKVAVKPSFSPSPSDGGEGPREEGIFFFRWPLSPHSFLPRKE